MASQTVDNEVHNELVRAMAKEVARIASSTGDEISVSVPLIRLHSKAITRERVMTLWSTVVAGVMSAMGSQRDEVHKLVWYYESLWAEHCQDADPSEFAPVVKSKLDEFRQSFNQISTAYSICETLASMSPVEVELLSEGEHP